MILFLSFILARTLIKQIFNLNVLMSIRRHSAMSVVLEDQTSSNNHCDFNFPRWQPTSKQKLEKVEKKILSALDIPYQAKFVKINEKDEIRTIHLNPTNSTRTPLVLMHGFGAGLGFWILNLKALAQRRPVYAFDTLGFGRSSRSRIPTGKDEAEEAFVGAIEDWRKAMNIEKMILMGHSFGGYLAFAYGIRHPNRLQHLILADPWGIPEGDEERRSASQMPIWVRTIAMIVLSFNPLASVRAAGPFGPSLVKKMRGDIQIKFSSLFDDDRILEYIYHCNAQTPASGESAFKSMSSFGAWSLKPMIHRATELPPEVRMHMIYGSESWMDQTMAIEMKKRRPDSFVVGRIIHGAGHHIYADKYEKFNQVVNDICDEVD